MKILRSNIVITKDNWPESLSDGLELSCSFCGKKPIIDYSVTDYLWKKTVPKKYRKNVVCLKCLSERCDPDELLENIVRIQITLKGITFDIDSLKGYIYTENKHNKKKHSKEYLYEISEI